MKILSIKMKYAEKRWPEYLEEVFGKETAEKMTIESRATASSHEAKIDLLNFKGSSAIIKTIKNNENVISAYIVKDNDINARIISRPFIKNIDEIPPPSRHLMDMEFYLKTKDRMSQSYLNLVPPNVPTASRLTSR